ncbi:hypothetical protein GCM10009682_46790 [Luedemannella flava]|uniref:DUF177 domain-containing protein n=1 Tax=Luedemannella flava TaxID=349316 RepID=A0ABP4YKK4_9ACTN
MGRYTEDSRFGKAGTVGAIVTLELPDDSPVLALPWIITFGPLDEDEDWEPVVCGPYERAHALSLAETVVADEELMAVVEPVLPHTTVDQIQAEIASAQLLAQEAEDEAVEDDEIEAFLDDHDHDHDEYDEGEEVEPSTPPSPEEIRAGFARIAAKLTSA